MRLTIQGMACGLDADLPHDDGATGHCNGVATGEVLVLPPPQGSAGPETATIGPDDGAAGIKVP